MNERPDDIPTPWCILYNCAIPSVRGPYPERWAAHDHCKPFHHGWFVTAIPEINDGPISTRCKQTYHSLCAGGAGVGKACSCFCHKERAR